MKKTLEEEDEKMKSAAKQLATSEIQVDGVPGNRRLKVVKVLNDIYQ